MKLLLVEDNAENCEMLSRRLRNRFYEVLVAKDGQEALEMAASQSPDLILLDMSLPVLNGWEVATALRADAATSDIPIIALTAHALEEDRQQALEAGCHEFETKPVAIERLIEKIQTLTSGVQ
jgi:two-component system cell cycle response regulator DivK